MCFNHFLLAIIGWIVTWGEMNETFLHVDSFVFILSACYSCPNKVNTVICSMHTSGTYYFIMTVCLEVWPSCSYIRLSLSTKFCHIKNIVLTFKCAFICQCRVRHSVKCLRSRGYVLYLRGFIFLPASYFFKTSLSHGLRYLWLVTKQMRDHMSLYFDTLESTPSQGT